MQRNNNNGSIATAAAGGGVHPACAACKHQRKKCDENCILSPYFPADKSREFQAVHKVFGVSNATKIIRNANSDEDRKKVADSLIWEAFCRQKDPVLGPYGEYRKIYEELTLYKSQNQMMLLQVHQGRDDQSAATHVLKMAPNNVIEWNNNNHNQNNSNNTTNNGLTNNNNINSKTLIDVKGGATINNVVLRYNNHQGVVNVGHEESLVDFSSYGYPSHSQKSVQDKPTSILPLQYYASGNYYKLINHLILLIIYIYNLIIKKYSFYSSFYSHGRSYGLLLYS
ncbi:hypothetical protein CCACVL1_28437 [Corchorus capsularis]|uniref:LOB domain-containing protein n=1 Tax=Corchorus capsularis TaxID=210143 RepID=A0A1R3G6H9_COCAP|nr:hypothetical protein CCACVL1_28437 [Corchorus capsularis]